MDKKILAYTHFWSPIIQMSDSVNNKFKRTDGKSFPKGKNIYFFQQEFYDMLTDGKMSSIPKANRQNKYHIIDDNICFLKGFKGSKYLMNKDTNFDHTLYKVIGFIEVEYNGYVKTTIVAEDITDTPEEFYIHELYESDNDDIFKTMRMESELY